MATCAREARVVCLVALVTSSGSPDVSEARVVTCRASCLHVALVSIAASLTSAHPAVVGQGRLAHVAHVVIEGRCGPEGLAHVAHVGRVTVDIGQRGWRKWRTSGE